MWTNLCHLSSFCQAFLIYCMKITHLDLAALYLFFGGNGGTGVTRQFLLPSCLFCIRSRHSTNLFCLVQRSTSCDMLWQTCTTCHRDMGLSLNKPSCVIDQVDSVVLSCVMLQDNADSVLQAKHQRGWPGGAQGLLGAAAIHCQSQTKFCHCTAAETCPWTGTSPP